MWGYQVWTAVDASGALRLAAEHRPHAILLDIGLPDLSGYEVVKRLRAQPDINGTLIVAVSGYGQPADRRRSLDAGFDQHVVKPVDALTLRDLLEQAASRAPAP
jgi:CheY-like chemotaxis protein